MSRETSDWLNNFTLIGFTDKRGNAWHWRQGTDNHFPGAIPLEVVRERLFFWKPVEGTVESTVVDNDGVYKVEDPGRKKIIRPATEQFGPAKIFGEFNLDTPMHDYEEWLITNVQNIVDDDVQIGSTGLLKGGAQAWVQIEMEENVQTPEGVEFRPFISAATSLDGSLATTYKRGNDLIVCDNTLHGAIANGDFRAKIKHTKNSHAKISHLRSTLGVLMQEAEDFSKEIHELTHTPVTPKQWDAFLDVLVPMPEVKTTKGGGPGAAYTRAETRRDKLTAMYRNDHRVADWTDTAFGVLQTINTFETHESTVKTGMHRGERNMVRNLADKKDSAANSDVRVLDILALVLS